MQADIERLITIHEIGDKVADLQNKREHSLGKSMANAIRDPAPDGETDEQREARLKQLAESLQEETARLNRLVIRDYFKTRMERLRIGALRIPPWPWIIWAAEVLIGSVAGAWLAFGQMRARPAGGETRSSA